MMIETILPKYEYVASMSKLIQLDVRGGTLTLSRLYLHWQFTEDSCLINANCEDYRYDLCSFSEPTIPDRQL